MLEICRGACLHGILSALEEHHSVSNSACRNAPDRRPVDRAVGPRNGLNEDGKMPLAGGWRRADKEPGIALAGDDDGLGQLGRGPKLNHQYDGSGYGRGHNRVHDDAQLAVIGVRLVRVKVGYLSHGKQRQKYETQTRDNRQEIVPGAASAAGMCLDRCQPGDLVILILQKSSFHWTAEGSRGCLNGVAFVTKPTLTFLVRLNCDHSDRQKAPVGTPPKLPWFDV